MSSGCSGSGESSPLALIKGIGGRSYAVLKLQSARSDPCGGRDGKEVARCSGENIGVLH